MPGCRDDCGRGDYPENLYAWLGETGPRVIRRHPDSPDLPRVTGVTLVDGSGHWAPIRLEGMRVTGTTRLGVWLHTHAFEIDACVLDSGIVCDSHYGPSVGLRLTRSRVHGGVGSYDRWLPDPDVVLESDTLVAGGLFTGGSGNVTIRNCVFQGPGNTALSLGLDSGAATITDNRIDGYQSGIAVG